jgi:hypothetical protein
VAAAPAGPRRGKRRGRRLALGRPPASRVRSPARPSAQGRRLRRPAKTAIAAPNAVQAATPTERLAARAQPLEEDGATPGVVRLEPELVDVSVPDFVSVFVSVLVSVFPPAFGSVSVPDAVAVPVGASVPTLMTPMPKHGGSQVPAIQLQFTRQSLLDWHAVVFVLGAEAYLPAQTRAAVAKARRAGGKRAARPADRGAARGADGRVGDVRIGRPGTVALRAGRTAAQTVAAIAVRQTGHIRGDLAEADRHARPVDDPSVRAVRASGPCCRYAARADAAVRVLHAGDHRRTRGRRGRRGGRRGSHERHHREDQGADWRPSKRGVTRPRAVRSGSRRAPASEGVGGGRRIVSHVCASSFRGTRHASLLEPAGPPARTGVAFSMPGAENEGPARRSSDIHVMDGRVRRAAGCTCPGTGPRARLHVTAYGPLHARGEPRRRA